MAKWTRNLSIAATVVLLSWGAWARAQEPAAGGDAPATPNAAQESELTLEEVRSLLDSIDPYRPAAEVSGELDVFGSTSMDVMAHGWATGFKAFHPQAKVVISAEGSETVVDRLGRSPGGIGMLSRPVSAGDLERLKAGGMKRPVAIQVARDALGVFVHQDNPLTEITYPQLLSLFCAEDPESNVTWAVTGMEGALSSQPVHLIGRGTSSGTQRFLEVHLFHQNKLRKLSQAADSNAAVAQAIGKDPLAIGISDFKMSAPHVKRLKLRDQGVVFAGNEREILLGHYPITRPLTLVFDLEADGPTAAANREFARYALGQAGQANAILAGFFPFDPPTLRSQLEKLAETEDVKLP